MKGTFFLNSIEYRIEVEGESWDQGDLISGKLSARSHSNNNEVGSLKIALAVGNEKKVRSKDSDAFEEVGKIILENAENTWEFRTPIDVAVTDKSLSPYLLYGPDSGSEMGQLRLDFRPVKPIQAFLGAFQSGAQFVIKSQKSKLKRVETKLLPPSGKAFSFVESVLVSMSCNLGKDLDIRYVFTVKTIDIQASKAGFKKEKKTFEQQILRSEYEKFDLIKTEVFESRIQEILTKLRENQGIIQN